MKTPPAGVGVIPRAVAFRRSFALALRRRRVGRLGAGAATARPESRHDTVFINRKHNTARGENSYASDLERDTLRFSFSTYVIKFSSFWQENV
jgi:hypothetical protein